MLVLYSKADVLKKTAEVSAVLCKQVRVNVLEFTFAADLKVGTLTALEKVLERLR